MTTRVPRALAARLDELNQERRGIEAKMQAEALAAVRVLSDPAPGALQRSGVCCSMRAGTRVWWAWSRAASRIACAAR